MEAVAGEGAIAGGHKVPLVGIAEGGHRLAGADGDETVVQYLVIVVLPVVQHATPDGGPGGRIGNGDLGVVLIGKNDEMGIVIRVVPVGLVGVDQGAEAAAVLVHGIIA